MKLDQTDEKYSKGIEVQGGREGRFIEKPDIIDKYCRREITKNNGLEELRPTQFGKMYEPINRRKTDNKKSLDSNEYNNEASDDENQENNETETESSEDEDEEKLTSTYIISPRLQQGVRVLLPQTIKINDPLPGEVAIWRKRNFPKAIRLHKKRADNDPHRYYLSELMLYTAYTDEKELFGDDEEKCTKLYLKEKNNIQLVKKYILPFAQGIEEARYYIAEAMKQDQNVNVGNHLDPEHEHEILECEEEEQELHPDFLQLNLDEQVFENYLKQTKKTSLADKAKDQK